MCCICRFKLLFGTPTAGYLQVDQTGHKWLASNVASLASKIWPFSAAIFLPPFGGTFGKVILLAHALASSFSSPRPC